MKSWLASDSFHGGLYSELDESEQYLPFGPERVVEIGGTQSVRAILETFDAAFHEAMEELVVEPEYDFEFVRNEQQNEINNTSEFDYTAEHLDTAANLIKPLAEELSFEYGGVSLGSIEEEWVGGTRALKLSFTDPAVPLAWVCVYLVRFGSTYTTQIMKCDDVLLKNKQHARYSMWMVRAKAMAATFPKPDQMFGRILEAETEARLWAAKHLLEKRERYEKDGTWPAAREIIRREINNSYLGELFAHARDRVNAKKASGQLDESATV
jgi:hypothetical protein